MRANLGDIYDETVTVINKLDARDAGQKQDVYRKTVIPHCMWTTKATRTVGSDGTVQVGTTQVVQIPENADYMPYRDWAAWMREQLEEPLEPDEPVSDEETTEPEEPEEPTEPDEAPSYFTIRTGDYLVKGVFEEDATAATLRNLIPRYEPDAFQVQLFRDATKGNGFTHSTAGIMRFTEAYVVEG